MWRFSLTGLPKNANLLKEALTRGFSCWPGSSGNWSIWMARRNPRFRRSRRGRGRPERTRRSRWTPSTAGLPTVRTCGPWQCRMSAGWCYRERPCKDIKEWSTTLLSPTQISTQKQGHKVWLLIIFTTLRADISAHRYRSSNFQSSAESWDNFRQFDINWVIVGWS